MVPLVVPTLISSALGFPSSHCSLTITSACASRAMALRLSPPRTLATLRPGAAEPSARSVRASSWTALPRSSWMFSPEWPPRRPSRRSCGAIARGRGVGVQEVSEARDDRWSGRHCVHAPNINQKTVQSQLWGDHEDWGGGVQEVSEERDDRWLGRHRVDPPDVP